VRGPLLDAPSVLSQYVYMDLTLATLDQELRSSAAAEDIMLIGV
jgi:hypothetical protein